jgi:hypothetical protein
MGAPPRHEMRADQTPGLAGTGNATLMQQQDIGTTFYRSEFNAQ